MANHKETGIIYKISPTENKSGSFAVREFVLQITDGAYQQFVKFQMTQSYCDLLDNFMEGQQVTVEFNLRGREHNGNFYTNLNAWRLTAISGAAPSSEPQAAEPVAAIEDEPPTTEDLLF